MKEKKLQKIMQDLENNHNWSWFEEIYSRNKSNLSKIALLYRGKKITYGEMFDHTLEYAKSLRTSPKLGENTINAKYVDSSTKKLLVKSTGNAMLKAGTEITCKKISKERNGRTWGSYGNCWICLKDASGTMNVKTVK